MAKESHLLTAEYATSVSLAATYFGSETRAAIEALRGKEWWQPDQATNRQKLVDAMGRELNMFPE